MTQHLKPCEENITESDSEIRAALEHCSVPALMMSMIHMSGDASLLQGDIRPNTAFMGEIQGFMPPEQQAAIREQALKMIADYRDRGCTLPAPPDRETVHAMMKFIVGDEVGEEYIDLIIEETNLYGDDRRAFHWDDRPDDETLNNFKVLVVGAGQSGVLCGIRLREAGIAHSIIEKNNGIGGTWWENDYPGARVDVANHFYSYSFEPHHDWPEHYSTQPELAAYFDRVAEKYHVKDSIRFETELLAAHWNEQAQCWDARLRQADGREVQESYAVIISGAGQLNRPKLPELEGYERFQGRWFHSANWDHSIDLEGKKIAIVGTGASAFQIVPAIADQGCKVKVFQRSPPWMFSNERYHATVEDGKVWCLKHLPYYARWYRFLHFWMMADQAHALLFQDPDWKEPRRSISEANEFTRQMFTEHITAQCGDDKELLAKVLPDYPPMGKRTLQDNGSWIGALRKPNVELVTESVVELTEQGLTDSAGDEHDFDIIVFATGFYATRFLWPMDIRGKGGISLQEWWGDDPVTNLGITTPNFPNLYCIYGPGNNLGHGGSLIFYSECQVRYILGCLKHMLENNLQELECTEEASRAYWEKFSEAAARTVWAHPAMDNWYKNKAGKVTTTSPWRLIDFWGWTKEPAMDEFRSA